MVWDGEVGGKLHSLRASQDPVFLCDLSLLILPGHMQGHLSILTVLSKGLKATEII